MREPKGGDVWERYWPERDVHERRKVLDIIDHGGNLWFVRYEQDYFGGVHVCTTDRAAWEMWAKKAEVIDDPE